MRKFTQEEFNEIYSKVPRICLEIVNIIDGKILLTKRAIEPFKGKWHIPGGTYFKEESIDEALRRIVKQELGCEINNRRFITYHEYKKTAENPTQDISLIFEVSLNGDVIIDEQAEDYGYFELNELPGDIIDIHRELLHEIINEN